MVVDVSVVDSIIWVYSFDYKVIKFYEKNFVYSNLVKKCRDKCFINFCKFFKKKIFYLIFI